MKLRLAVIGLGILLAARVLWASGPLGVYAIVDKVVLEPNDQAPERIQVWGSFALADTSGGGFTPATRGYLYLRIPSTAATAAASIRNEWADLKSVAGTGEAVAFGRWQYMGSLEDIQAPPPSRSGVTAAGTRIMDVRGLIVAPNGGGVVNLRVRHAAEPVVNPIDYAANVGVVKLTEASHAAVLKALREAR